jgi:hypothetical protein
LAQSTFEVTLIASLSPPALPEKPVDLRQHKRYRLAAPVSFEWTNKTGVMQKGEGYTRDISSAAVFVVTSELLSIASAVRLHIELPGLLPDNSGPSLNTQAHVIRVERGGFAAIADAGFRVQIQGIDAKRKSLKDEEIPLAKQLEFQHN